MSGVDIASLQDQGIYRGIYIRYRGRSHVCPLYGLYKPIHLNLDLSTNYVVMLMVGGLGSVVGTIFGSAIVTILPEMLRFLGNYYQIVFCSIILLGAIFFPDGWVSAATGLFMKMYQRISGKSYAEGGE